MAEFLLSEKYQDFLRHNASVEYLEGTTFAGKTTVGILKFMLKVAQSPKKLHIISGLDTGVVEKNIINKDYGILDVFNNLVQYNPSGRGKHSLPHLQYQTDYGEKIIYILGYDNEARWKKALGGQYGCIYIDEINIANMEYVREATMRCDYLMGTLNPDDPDKPIYKEYVNHSRPIDKYKNDGPAELRAMLSEEHNADWTWWFFSFDHNLSLTPEKRNDIIIKTPVGTKQYKNKILGLRGRCTGLVFVNFDRKKHTISTEDAKKLIRKGGHTQSEYFIKFSVGVDTAYSSQSPDTIAMTFIGITNKGKCVLLDERTYNNANLDEPIAPSDTVKNLVEFLDRNCEEWGQCSTAFIDSADQATITECRKYKRQHGCLYTFMPAYKKTKIIDRIKMQLGWFAHSDFLVVDTCKNYISELETYSWLEDKDNTPEDGHDHGVNSCQYAFLPFKNLIGVDTNGDR